MSKRVDDTKITLDAKAIEALAYIGGIPATQDESAIPIHKANSLDEKAQFHALLDKWLSLYQSEMQALGNTVMEVIKAVDVSKKNTRERLASLDYIKLLRKSFRSFAIIESETKQAMVQQLLINAAVLNSSPDYALSLFIDWLDTFSEEHFRYLKEISTAGGEGITRKSLWLAFHDIIPGEDTAQTDLFKNIIHDLSTAHVIRQTKDKDFYGNFIKQPGGKKKEFFDKRDNDI